VSQKIREVLVTGADGSKKRLALVRTEGGVAYVCSVEKTRCVGFAELEQWLVGFPVSDVRERDGGPLKG